MSSSCQLHRAQGPGGKDGGGHGSSYGLTSSINSQGWQAPPSRDGFFSPCSNRALRAGQRVPRTRSVTPSVTVSSPAMEYCWWGMGSERPQPCTCSQSPCPCPHIPCLKPEIAQDTGPGQEGASLARVEAAAAPRGSPALCPSYLFAPFIQDFHELGWKPACGRGRVL